MSASMTVNAQARDAAPHYQHSEIGYNYRMSNICAGIGRGQMKVLDEHVRSRRDMNSFYRDIFAAKVGVRVFTEPGPDYFSNHWLTCLMIEEKFAGFTGEELRMALESKQIESRPLWKPMHLQPVFKDAAYYGENVAETFFEKGLCLPSGSNLNNSDLERITEVLAEFI